jgi:tRNA threonylcarbamoyladenosine biosynthesis protein TsaB
MKLLALDTSTEYLSLALWQGGEALCRDLHAGQRHAELILPLVGELLAEAGLTMNQLDGIAFGEGPGSFTGLRVGCGVTQGLAFGADIPVVGIGTLLALAASCGHSKVIACIDARMKEIYHAAYVQEAGVWQEICAPGVYAPQHAPEVNEGGWVGAGSGWLAYPEVLPQRYVGQLEQVLPDVFPHAREIAALAVPVFSRGEGRPATEAAPLYIRNKVAFTMSERSAKAALDKTDTEKLAG